MAPKANRRPHSNIIGEHQNQAISCLKTSCVLSVHCCSSSCKRVYNHWWNKL